MLLAGAALAWAAALPLAALAAERSDQTVSTAGVFALAIYQIGSLICHQLPERSFQLGSAALPVCARCAGIYAGAAAASLVAMFGLHPARRNRAGGVARARVVLTAAAMPALATLAYEWTRGDAPSNVVRAVTGLCLGAGVAWVLVRLE